MTFLWLQLKAALFYVLSLIWLIVGWVACMHFWFSLRVMRCFGPDLPVRWSQPSCTDLCVCAAFVEACLTIAPFILYWTPLWDSESFSQSFLYPWHPKLFQQFHSSSSWRFLARMAMAWISPIVFLACITLVSMFIFRFCNILPIHFIRPILSKSCHQIQTVQSVRNVIAFTPTFCPGISCKWHKRMLA